MSDRNWWVIDEMTPAHDDYSENSCAEVEDEDEFGEGYQVIDLNDLESLIYRPS